MSWILPLSGRNTYFPSGRETDFPWARSSFCSLEKVEKVNAFIILSGVWKYIFPSFPLKRKGALSGVVLVTGRGTIDSMKSSIFFMLSSENSGLGIWKFRASLRSQSKTRILLFSVRIAFPEWRSSISIGPSSEVQKGGVYDLMKLRSSDICFISIGEGVLPFANGYETMTE